MKKLLLPVLIAVLSVSLCSCGEKTESEPVTLFPEVTGQTEKKEETPSVKVNDTYDEVLFELTEADNVPVLDDSIDYRTTDSYKYEERATSAAVELFNAAVERYSDVKIDRISIYDCMDDGEAVYYSFSIGYGYTVESGGHIDNVYNCNIGIKKSDESAFDSSPYIYDVMEKYSLFVESNDENAYGEYPCDGDEESVKDAVRQFATDRLKKRDTAQVFSVTKNDDGMYEIVCSGENSYGLIIKDSLCVTAEYSAESGIVKIRF